MKTPNAKPYFSPKSLDYLQWTPTWIPSVRVVMAMYWSRAVRCNFMVLTFMVYIPDCLKLLYVPPCDGSNCYCILVLLYQSATVTACDV